MRESHNRILGIDPGTRFTGIGIVDRLGNGLRFVWCETIVTVNMKELDEKLVAIYTRIVELIQTYHPETASIEKIFHSVNPRSSLLLGHARGVSMLAAKMAKLEVVEYSPNQVKSAVTGVGRASKEQVKSMVRILLNMDRTKLIKEDESDALAIAICHANTMDFSTNNSGERR